MFGQGGLFQDTSGPFKQTLSVIPITGKAGGFEYGDKIILPDNVLQMLLARDIAYPMLFKLQTPDKKSIYCGVSEFTADAGQCYLPQWMMTQLSLREGNTVDLFNVMLQKGQYLLLRPHTYKFIKRFDDPKTIFEQHINKYATLTRGTTIQICAGGEVWYFDIVDLKPARAVCIIDTDLKMDFDEPRDIKEYEAKLREDLEERKIRDKFIATASDYQTEQLLSPQVQIPATPHFSGSPVTGGTPFVAPQQNTGGFDGASIFAEASDDDEHPTPLSTKLGQGMSLKKNAVIHGAPTPSSATSTSAGGKTASTPMSTNAANRQAVFGSGGVSSPSPIAEDEAAKKRERDRLIRLQRAALYTKGAPAPTTTTTTTTTTTKPSAAAAPQFTQAEKELLGLNKELQQGVGLAGLDHAMAEASSEGNQDKVGFTTEQQGEWIFYKDAQGKLIRKELAVKSFAMSGVGNTLKK